MSHCNSMQSIPMGTSGRQLFGSNSLLFTGIFDGSAHDTPYCFDNLYHIRNSGCPQNPIDLSTLDLDDFSNFPWLPEFDRYTLNQHQPACINPSNFQNISSSNGLSTGNVSSSDSSSEFSSGGEVDALTNKSLKRKTPPSDDSIAEGDLDRREKNRLNAKKARLRKKQLLGSLQGQLALLKGENSKLRRLIAARMPEKSMILLNKSTRLAEELSTITSAP